MSENVIWSGKKTVTRRSVSETLLGTACVLAVLFVSTMLPGCATTTQSAQLPPIPSSQSGTTESGKFVWVDLLTENTADAAAFYEALFDWRAAPSSGDKNYLLFSLDGKPIAGMTAAENKDGKAPESWWLLSLSVADVDQAVTVAMQNGGKVLEGPVSDAGRGRMALVSDPSGAPLILLSAAGSHTAGESPPTGAWFWTDLYTRDAKSAQAFYGALAGFEKQPLEAVEGERHFIFTKDGTARAGVVEPQWDDLEDNWLPYVKVEDVSTTIGKARQLGGNVLLERGDVAILVDPTGAVFGIQAQ